MTYNSHRGLFFIATRADVRRFVLRLGARAPRDPDELITEGYRPGASASLDIGARAFKAEVRRASKKQGKPGKRLPDFEVNSAPCVEANFLPCRRGAIARRMQRNIGARQESFAAGICRPDAGHDRRRPLAKSAWALPSALKDFAGIFSHQAIEGFAPRSIQVDNQALHGYGLERGLLVRRRKKRRKALRDFWGFGQRKIRRLYTARPPPAPLGPKGSLRAGGCSSSWHDGSSRPRDGLFGNHCGFEEGERGRRLGRHVRRKA